MMLEIVKKLYRTFRVPCLWIRYDYPLVRKKLPNEIRSINDVLQGVNKLGIIGRAQSITWSDYRDIINQCDFTILLNRVEIETLENNIGNKFDAQLMQPPPPYAALPNKLIKKYNIRYLMSNKRLSGKKFKIFFRGCSNRDAEIIRYPEDSEMSYQFSKSQNYAPTQCGSLIKSLYNVESITDVYFFGVDFFTSGYYRNQITSSNIAPKRPHDTNFEEKGLPLINYIKNTLPQVNEDRELNFHFLYTLKDFFGQSLDCIKYYE